MYTGSRATQKTVGIDQVSLPRVGSDHPLLCYPFKNQLLFFMRITCMLDPFYQPTQKAEIVMYIQVPSIQCTIIISFCQESISR